VQPVVAVDGRPVGGGMVGPVTREVARVFDAQQREQLDP
jgi:branched-subunit amino acid aminotransferase/4-amino-4-deoxychorismate lyase